jgi:hypothetical protein
MTEVNDRPELMIGLVSPIGIDLDSVQNTLADYLNQFGYKLNAIKLSSLIRNVTGLKTKLVSDPEAARIASHMTAGDEARQKAGRGDFLAALAIQRIHQQRSNNNEDPMPQTAHLLRSLKHPDEVQLLRDVYGDGFHLLGIASSRTQKLKYLTKQKGIPDEEAEGLIRRDESEEPILGQHMRDTFHLADCFIDIDDAGDARDQIGRFLDAGFGKPHVRDLAFHPEGGLSIRQHSLATIAQNTSLPQGSIESYLWSHIRRA